MIGRIDLVNNVNWQLEFGKADDISNVGDRGMTELDAEITLDVMERMYYANAVYDDKDIKRSWLNYQRWINL